MLPVLGPGDARTFLSEFYDREQPVLLRGVATRPGATDAIARTLMERIDRDEPAERETLLWHDVRPELVETLCETPPLVLDLLDRDRAFLRERHVRVWLSVRGHSTPWHYDGNSLQVFNLQLRGSKRWRIVSPETPPMCLPFSTVGLRRDIGLGGRRAHEFDTEEGDLLFLPRYWFHSVRSTGELNVNLNWVLTPKRGPLPSPTARREAELLWIKRRLYPLLTPGLREDVDTYAGEGREAVEALTAGVSAGAAALRALRETLKIPLLLALLPAQLASLSAMKRSRRRLRARLLDPAATP